MYYQLHNLSSIVTGVVAKVIFLHLSVIHSVHGGGEGSASVHAGIPPPPDQTPPPGKQTPAYGLRAVGTHPTGMHSCQLFFNTYRHAKRFSNLTLLRIRTQVT